MIDLPLGRSLLAPALVLLLTGCHDDPPMTPAGPGSTTTGTSTTDVVGTSTGDASSSSSSSSGAVDSTTGSSGSGSTGETSESSGTTGPGIVDPGCPECLVLAEELQGGRGLSVHAEWVYFTDQDAGTVNRVPKGGGAIEVVANFQNQPYDVVANDEHALWTTFVEGGSVWRAELPSGFPVALSADDFPRMMQLVGDHVYWCTFDDLLGRVRRVPSSGIGNAPETLVAVGSGVADLVVYGSQVYFTVHLPPLEPGLAPQGLVYMAAADVPTDPLDLGIIADDQSEPWGIAAAADTVFWANGLGSPDDQPQSVVSAPSSGGGALDVVAMDQLSPFGVAADDQYVYWTDYTEVRAVSHAGGEPIDLAVMQNVARAIAVDDADVFWITRSRVLQRPKP